MIWKLVSRVLLVCVLAVASLSSVAAQTTSDEEPSARVIIAHLAPFADTVEGTSVSILVNGEPALEDFVFGDATDYIELPAGDYQVDVVPTGTSEPAISGELTLEAGQDYTAAAIGDGANQPLELLALEDDNSAPEEHRAKLRIVHTAPFAAELSDTAVDVRKENGRVFKGLRGVEYKQASPYLDIRARTFDLKITAPGGHPTLIDIPPVTFESGDIVTVFAIGDGVNQPTGVLPVAGSPRDDNGDEPARVIIAHLAPFADTVEGTSVSVLVNGEPALEDFVFGDATDYIELPAGEYQVDIVPTGADDPAISGELMLEAGQDYTAAAIGDGANQPLELLALEDDNSAPEEHRAKLRIVHTAPFAAELSDTAVDIRRENGRLFAGLAGVEYKQASPYLDIRARTFDLKITAPGGHPTLIDIPPVTFESGDIVTVFAIGDGVNQPTGVLPIAGSPRDNGGEEKPARVTIAHLAPFADTVEGTSVSVLVNGEPALEDFVFGDTTDFIELPAGEYQVDIVPTGADDPAISGALTLEAGQDYTAAAIGDGANQPLELLALEDDNTPAGPGNAKIRVVHAAPFAAELADTEVDIRTERGDVVGELTNVPYKVASSYLEVPVGLYDLKITTPGGEQTLIDIPPFIVFNNTVVTVFAIGDGANQPVGVTATTGGTPFFVFPTNAH